MWPNSLYPDLARRGERPPSIVEAEAREWIAGEPVMWQAERAGDIGPSETLAIIGALVLSAALGQPCGWCELSLRGRTDLLGALSRIEAFERSEGRFFLRLHDNADRDLALRHGTSKLWSGQITTQRIWDQSQIFARRWDEARDETNPDGDERDEDEGRHILPLDIALAHDAISATGYDERIVAISISGGFQLSRHQSNMRLVGGRPLVELLGLIGGSKIEAAGRWPMKRNLCLPILAGAVLRDVLDLDRMLMLEADSLPCGVAAASEYRSYLRSLA